MLTRQVFLHDGFGSYHRVLPGHYVTAEAAAEGSDMKWETREVRELEGESNFGLAPGKTMCYWHCPSTDPSEGGWITVRVQEVRTALHCTALHPHHHLRTALQRFLMLSSLR